MSCLDDETVFGYLQRRLAASRSRSVELHLDRCAACRRLIAALAATSLLQRSAAVPPPQAWSSDFLPPGVAIGRYLVEARIGSGATGVVYRAHDPRLGRAVAIKQLRAEIAGQADLRARFIAEARTLARLSHPNVVPVYDVGIHGEHFADHVFIAMELVDGVTLRQCAGDRRRDAILELYRQAARGLIAAHEHGICHGDFKPDNVLVTHDGRVLVADFGLLGTPAYMAPEQLESGMPSPAADQFAWCVALFEALTGERPFAGDSIAALRRSIERGTIAASILRLPRWLQAVLRRGLDPDPERRFAGLAALLSALDRRPRPLRWPWVAAAVGALVLAIVPTTRARPPATQPEPTHDEQTVASAAPLRAAELAFAEGRVADAREQAQAVLVAAQASGDDVTAAAALVMRGRIEGLTGSVDIALRTLTEAYWLAIATRATGVTVDAATEMSRVLAIDAERFDESAEWLRHADAALQRLGPDRNRALALMAARATLATVRGDWDAAREDYERAIAGLQQRPRPNIAAIAAATSNLGVVFEKQGRDTDAMRAHEEALALLDGAGLDAHFVYGRVLLNLASAEWRSGRFPQSREHNERALAVFVDALGPDSALVGRASNNLGTVLQTLGDFDGCAKAYDRAEVVLRGALGADHPTLATVLVGQAAVSFHRGRFIDARDQLERAAGILERAHGLDDPGLAPILGNLGDVANLLGDSAGARRNLEKSVEVLERAHGPDHPRLAGPLEELANTLAGRGELDEAERMFDRAYAIRTSRVGDEDVSLYRYWLGIGKVQLERGDQERADDALERAEQLAENATNRSAVQLVRAEALWRDGRRQAAIAMARRAREALAADPTQPGLTEAIDGWLAERVGSAQ